MPHGEKYPDIAAMVDKLRLSGCQVFAYVTTRDWASMLCSRVKAGIVNFAVASQRAQWAYPHIFEHLTRAKVPYAMVSYEAVTGIGEKYIKRMLKLFGLEMGDLPEIYSGNEKYYEGEFVQQTLDEVAVQRPDWLVD